MAEITEASYDSEGYRQIMGVIARRLQDIGEAWRHVYKSLLLLEYMLKHGPQKVSRGYFSGLYKQDVSAANHAGPPGKIYDTATPRIKSSNTGGHATHRASDAP